VLWHYRSVAVTQRVGSPLPFAQRPPVAGAGLRAHSCSLGSFRLYAINDWTSPTGQGPMTSATDSSRRNTPHPLDELERAPNPLRHRLQGICHNTRQFLWYPVLLHHPDPGRP
jgi:hypothetical protein